MFSGGWLECKSRIVLWRKTFCLGGREGKGEDMLYVRGHLGAITYPLSFFLPPTPVQSTVRLFWRLLGRKPGLICHLRKMKRALQHTNFCPRVCQSGTARWLVPVGHRPTCLAADGWNGKVELWGETKSMLRPLSELKQSREQEITLAATFLYEIKR